MITKLYTLLAVTLIMFLGLFLYFWLDDVGYCLEQGNVWDYGMDTCREDCLHWNYEKGCIRLTAEEVNSLKECERKSTPQLPNGDCYQRVALFAVHKKYLQYYCFRL